MEDLSEYTGIEKMILQAKYSLYFLMHEIVSCKVASPYFYYFLTMVQTLQMLYYLILKKYKFIWPTDFTSAIRNFTEYVQFETILEQGNQTINLTILYSVFFFQLIMLIKFVIGIVKMSDPKKNRNNMCFSYTVKGLSVYALFLNTVLLIPFFNIVIATLYCDSNSEVHDGVDCYNGIYILHLIVAILTGIYLLGFAFLFASFYIDLNPNSPLPFAQPQHKINVLKSFVKLILPSYPILDYKGDIAEAFIVIVTILYLLILFERIRNPPFYNKNIFNFTVVCEALLFWISLCVCIHAFLDFGDKIDDVGIVYTILGCPIVGSLTILYINKRNTEILQQTSRYMQNGKEIEMYIVQLLDLVSNNHKPENQLMIEAVIRFHARDCNKAKDCVCEEFMAAKEGGNNQINRESEEELLKMKKKLYRFVQTILQEEMSKNNSNSPQLYLLNAYILNQNLSNQFKALYQLMNAAENKPNVQQEFSIFRYKIFIEEQLIENDNKQIEEKAAIEKCVTLYLEFWRELLDENSDIQKLELLGSKITSTLENIQDLFKKLIELNPNHLRCLTTYGYFLKDIVSDENESHHILEKMQYVQKSSTINNQFVDDDRLKYGENSNTCIIKVSGNKQSMSNITNVNNEIFRLLGFNNDELLEHSVSMLMPKIYADFHDSWMDRYLQSSESKVIGQERFLMAQNKQGYLVPVTLMIKVIPNLKDGIQLVGFMNNYVDQVASGFSQEPHYLLYNTVNQVILGVSQSCYDSFGIPSVLVYGNSNDSNEFTIDLVAPEIDQPGPNQDELAQPQGCLVTFDTTYIQQNFLLQDGNSTQSDYNDYDSDIGNNDTNMGYNNNTTMQASHIKGLQTQQNNVTQMSGGGDQKQESVPLKQKKFKKSMVRVHLESEEEYNQNCNVRLLKFFEVEEGEKGGKFFQTGMKSTLNSVHKNSNTPGGQYGSKNNNNNAGISRENSNNFDEDYEEYMAQNDSGYHSKNNKKMSQNDDPQYNEELRYMNDFKAMISKKSEPKSIQMLKKCMILMFLIMVVLSSIELHYKSLQNDGIKEGVEAIDSTYMRHNTMVDINYESRKIQLAASDIITPVKHAGDSQKEVKYYQGRLYDSVSELQKLEFRTIQASIDRKNRDGVPDLEKQMFQLKFLLQTGEVKEVEHVYTDAVFQYITAASSLTNATYSSFETVFNFAKDGEDYPKYKDNSFKNMFLVRDNGLFVLRKGSEDIAEDYFDYYHGLTEDFQKSFLIIMIGAVVFVMVTQMFLIPIVFNVHKTNNKVLSLFGIIPGNEVKALALNCEVFIQEYLEDQKQQQNREMKKAELNATHLGVNQYNNANPGDDKLNDSKMPMMKDNINGDKQQQDNVVVKQNGIQSNVLESERQIQTGKQSIATAKQTERESLATNQISNRMQKGGSQATIDMKAGKQAVKNGLDGEFFAELEDYVNQKKQQIDDQKQQEDYDGERGEKLSNQSDGNKKLYVICQFSFFACLFIGYFVINFIIENQLVNQLKTIYTQLKYDCIRPSLLKYNVLFTLEDILEGQKQSMGDIDDLRKWFQAEILENDRKLFSSFNDEYPNDFNDYKAKFDDLNDESICIHLDGIGEKEMSEKECKDAANGILEKGLRTSIHSLTGETSRIISTYSKEIGISGSDKTEIVKNTLNSNTVEKMQKYMVPAMIQLKELMLNNIYGMLDENSQMEMIKFIIFLVILVLLFGLVWMPYLKKLNNKIWRTKGMLNMIPMDIIIRNSKLSQVMKQKEIQDAVK